MWTEGLAQEGAERLDPFSIRPQVGVAHTRGRANLKTRDSRVVGKLEIIYESKNRARDLGVKITALRGHDSRTRQCRDCGGDSRQRAGRVPLDDERVDPLALSLGLAGDAVRAARALCQVSVGEAEGVGRAGGHAEVNETGTEEYEENCDDASDSAKHRSGGFEKRTCGARGISNESVT